MTGWMLPYNWQQLEHDMFCVREPITVEGGQAVSLTAALWRPAVNSCALCQLLSFAAVLLEAC